MHFPRFLLYIKVNHVGSNTKNWTNDYFLDIYNFILKIKKGIVLLGQSTFRSKYF